MLQSAIKVNWRQDFNFTINAFPEFGHQVPIDSGKFRANYYAFCIIREGQGIHNIDDKSFPISPYSYYFSTPLHLRSFYMQKQWTGFLITFDEAFLKEFGRSRIVEHFSFLYDEPYPLMNPSKEDFNQLMTICKSLKYEDQRPGPNQKFIIGHYLNVLLFKTKELLQRQKVLPSPQNNPKFLLTSFKKKVTSNIASVINRENLRILNVSEFAHELNVESNYLSHVIKQETGLSAKSYIDRKILNEAKSLILNTNQTSAEIAHSLSFSDPSNFNRFFKKHTSLTPNQYRQQQK